jgi:hypothetical protein
LIPTAPANRRDVEKWTLFKPDLLQIRIQIRKFNGQSAIDEAAYATDGARLGFEKVRFCIG